MNATAKPKFGDLVQNGWASDDNPTKRGFFVREIRSGARSATRTWEITDGKGKFWRCPLDHDHKLTWAPAAWNRRSSPIGGEEGGEPQHAEDCQSHIVDTRGRPDPCTCGAFDAERTAELATEGFIKAVAAIAFHDDSGGPYALNYAVTNTLHGRGSLDKVTRRTVASAIRTLQAVIREAQALQNGDTLQPEAKADE